MTIAVEAADTTLPALMERIEHGDEVRLLKDGQTVATLSPINTERVFPERTPDQIARATAALARADERAKRLGLKFDMEEFKADKEFGRR